MGSSHRGRVHLSVEQDIIVGSNPIDPANFNAPVVYVVKLQPFTLAYWIQAPAGVPNFNTSLAQLVEQSPFK